MVWNRSASIASATSACTAARSILFVAVNQSIYLSCSLSLSLSFTPWPVACLLRWCGTGRPPSPKQLQPAPQPQVNPQSAKPPPASPDKEKNKTITNYQVHPRIHRRWIYKEHTSKLTRACTAASSESAISEASSRIAWQRRDEEITHEWSDSPSDSPSDSQTGYNTKGTRAHTHRELIRKWHWEPKGSSLECI